MFLSRLKYNLALALLRSGFLRRSAQNPRSLLKEGFSKRRVMSTSEIAACKAALREKIAEKLKTLTKEEKIRQSEEVFKKLTSLKTFQESKRFSTFLSIDNEIDTEPIVRKIFSDGKECFVPRYNKKKMEMVKLHSIQDWETLPVTSWGIKQPSFKDARENALETGGLDFIVVPGVAFTSSGLRMGHGGGYYDRFMESIRKSQVKPPALVAVAFKEQIVDDLPVTETDVQIDLVLYAN